MATRITTHDLIKSRVLRGDDWISLDFTLKDGGWITIFCTEADLTELLDQLNAHKTRNADKVIGDLAIIDDYGKYSYKPL